MIKILIADDHQVFLDGLQAILKQERDIEVKAEALNGEEVLLALKKTAVDIIVLDIEMPKKNGIEVAKEVNEKYPGIKILILTMYDKREFINQVLLPNVKGFILKNKSSEELVRAIHEIYNGRTFYGQEIMMALKEAKQKTTSEGKITLTKREEDVLRLIAKEYTSPKIAQTLHIAPSTVETHRRNLIGKLGVKSTLGLVKWAVENGYT